MSKFKLGKKRIIFLAAVAVVVIVIVVVMANKNGTSKTSVQTILAEKQGIIETVTATGRIEPATKVKISADVAAKIIFLGVNEGDWVEKGDLLVRLDQERYIAALEQTEASYRSVQASAELARETLVKAEKDLERKIDLRSDETIPQATLDQAQAGFDLAKARLAAAEASLSLAQRNYDRSVIRAPSAGAITERMVAAAHSMTSSARTTCTPRRASNVWAHRQPVKGARE